MKLRLKDTVDAIRYDGQNFQAIKDFCESKEFCQFEILYVDECGQMNENPDGDYFMTKQAETDILIWQMKYDGGGHDVEIGDIFWTWDGKNVEHVSQEDMWELAFEIDEGSESPLCEPTSGDEELFDAMEKKLAEDFSKITFEGAKYYDHPGITPEEFKKLEESVQKERDKVEHNND